MKRYFFLLSFGLVCLISSKALSQSISPEQARKIQVAILLDVSGSMDGLIEQAKSQLWNMVTVLGKAKCGTQTPKIEIALYEYGRTTNDAKLGYVKQLSGFTTDLDKLSAILFGLKTDGGDEFCGHVIKSSLDELGWDAGEGNYKVIFIAGNEDFLQGGIKYTDACAIARQKGVIVNTIYCGDKQQGVAEHWNLAGECGQGSFTNINQNAKEEDIDTPFDSAMYVMNGKLNGTYVAYGENGTVSRGLMSQMDEANEGLGKNASLSRTNAKATRAYTNVSWDLVDANTQDSTIIEKIDTITLPANLRNKSRKEIRAYVEQKAKERSAIQKEISNLNALRNSYITEERKKRAVAANNAATLETEIEKILKEQAKRFKITIE
jgi:hypothetical protein